jgi:hypothetical protein
MMFRPLRLAPSLLLCLLLSACDLAELLADPRVAQREADAKAIGGACRFGLRSIEDCYTLNPKASKAAVFAGWKEMDQYMRDNKVDGAPAKITDSGNEATAQATSQAKSDPKGDKSKASDKTAEKTSDKTSEKSSDKIKADKPAASN